MTAPRCFLLTGLLLLVGTHAASQAPRGSPLPNVFDEESLDPLAAKALAKAKYDALRADPKELARAKADAARVCLAYYQKSFLDGRVHYDMVLETQVKVAEAELAISGTDEQRVAVLEQIWLAALATESLNKGRFEAGRIHEYADSTCRRLDAEFRWLQARNHLLRKESIPPALMIRRAKGRKVVEATLTKAVVMPPP